MEGCIFCEIVEGKAKSYKTYEDDWVLCVLDIHPVNMGHCLLMPKQHAKDMFDMDEDTYYAIMDAVKLVSKTMKNTLNATGISILHSSAKEDGDEKFHFHIHLIPRYAGDEVDISMKSGYKEKNFESVANKIKC